MQPLSEMGEVSEVGLPDPERSRAVLIGNSRYSHPELPDQLVIRNNIMDLYALLADPEHGTFLPENCEIILDEADQGKVGEQLLNAAREASDLLLVYYAGHGLLGTPRHELHLALTRTNPNAPVLGFSALPFDRVRDACLTSVASSRVVILDCCYSGRAIGTTLANEPGAVVGQIQISGTYTLTSAPANSLALVRPGEPHTAFTGRLLTLLDSARTALSPLMLGDLYRQLRSELNAAGLPLPQQCGTEEAEQLELMRNRPREGVSSAWRMAVLHSGDQLVATRMEADRLLDEARRQAAAIHSVAETDAVERSERAIADAAANMAAKQAEAEADIAKRREEFERGLAARQAKAEKRLAVVEARAEQLSLEAHQLRADAERRARQNVETAQRQADDILVGARVEADRLRNEAASGQVVEKAQNDAELLRAEAAKDAAELRANAEALFEVTRAKAAQAAADFETDLTKRRDQAGRDLAGRQAKAEKRLAEVEARAEQLRLEAELGRANAERRARQTVETGQRQADDIVLVARSEAARLRSEAEQELAALTQRRDRINEQLTTVRGMLATLTGQKLPHLMPPLTDDGGDIAAWKPPPN